MGGIYNIHTLLFIFPAHNSVIHFYCDNTCGKSRDGTEEEGLGITHIFMYTYCKIPLSKMPQKKSFFTPISKRPNKAAQNKMNKLVNLSNLKTNVQRELNILTPKFGQLSLKSRREKELELARNIINRVRRSSPVLGRRVDKMMLKEGYQRLDKRKSKSK